MNPKKEYNGLGLLLMSGLALLVCSALNAMGPMAPMAQNTGDGTTPNDSILPLDRKLPLDAAIRKGVLKNGMTYYLHHTEVEKGVASYYIIQNVGSILENDGQQGLAHFLEHMAFNGTKGFPDKGILEAVQKEGLVFGRDLNAYTGFDETVYNISNLPTGPELIDMGLGILHDWSNYLLLTDREIDAERGVIKEEWRTRQNGRMRIFQKTVGTLANHSKYGERLPIGKMDIVENFEYGTLRDFYHDWYRTDLQAIAVIGDIDVDEMEARIVAKFSAIPSIPDPPERYEVDIEDHGPMMFAMAMDKEISTPEISFSVRQRGPSETSTVRSLRFYLINNMINSMLSSRFRELVQSGAPFTNAGASLGRHGLARLHRTFRLRVYPRENRQHEAFELAMSELYRAVLFGFTHTEIERTKAEFHNLYENYANTLGNRSHQTILALIKNDYLNKEAITDPTSDHAFAKRILEGLTNKDFVERLRELYTKKNRVLLVTGVAGQKNLTENEALSIIEKVENDSTLQPYGEEALEVSLLTGIETNKGTILSEVQHRDIGATEFRLGNGIKVFHKFVDKVRNDVKLEAISQGGTSLLTLAEGPSSTMVSHLVDKSGVGNFDAIELEKAMAGKTVSSNVRIDPITESVNGSSSSKDVETMLQQVYLRFTAPRFDKNSYEVMVQDLDNHIIRKSQNIRYRIQDSITTILYGKEHPRKRLFDKAYVEDISFEKIEHIYRNRFSNAADFTFFIVGDISKEKLRPWLKAYIASIPTTHKNENFKDVVPIWLEKNIDREVHLEMEDPKAVVHIDIRNKIGHSLKNEFLMRALGGILQLRYTELLREEEGGTYGARVRSGLTKEPKQEGYLRINFDCDPELVDNLVALVHKEIRDMAKGRISQKDLDKTLKSYSKQRQELKNYNKYGMYLLKNYVLEDYNMDEPINFEAILESISTEDVRDMMAMLLDDPRSYELVFRPRP